MKRALFAATAVTFSAWQLFFTPTSVFGQTDGVSPAGSTGNITGLPSAGPAIEPLVRVVDLTIGQQKKVELADGSTASVRLLDVKETRDPVRQAIRKTEVRAEVNGQPCTLAAGLYHLPVTVAGVQIDCEVTGGYNVNNTRCDYALEADARLRLWPGNSPLLRPGTFCYPLKQRWFATLTWSDIEPIDGGRTISNQVGYHNGVDLGGAEGMVEIIAATDAVVVSSRGEVLDEYDEGAPVQPRYDVVYLRDRRGWYYRYSHFQSIDPGIVPGRVLKQGDRLGILGKEGASGGWTHLHFHIASRQPSGKWGLQNAYAFLHEAYRNQYKPPLLACARPQQMIRAGESVVLDATPSWSACGSIRQYDWTFTDRTTATGARVERVYPKPGKYSEILRVTDSEGNIDYDFAVVQVLNLQHPDRYTPSLHATYAPSFGVRPGDPITFQVRASRISGGEEVWDFGDGSPPVRTCSDGNIEARAPDGYAKVVHRYAKPGHYLVHVCRHDEDGTPAHARLHVYVGEK